MNIEIELKLIRSVFWFIMAFAFGMSMITEDTNAIIIFGVMWVMIQLLIMEAKMKEKEVKEEKPTKPKINTSDIVEMGLPLLKGLLKTMKEKDKTVKE